MRARQEGRQNFYVAVLCFGLTSLRPAVYENLKKKKSLGNCFTVLSYNVWLDVA